MWPCRMIKTSRRLSDVWKIERYQELGLKYKECIKYRLHCGGTISFRGSLISLERFCKVEGAGTGVYPI